MPKKTGPTLRIWILLIISALYNAQARAVELTPQSPESEEIAASYAYTTNLAGNPIGGKSPGKFTYTDNHLITVAIPVAGNLGGLTNNKIILSGYDRNGTNLSAIAIGNQFTVQQIYGIETYGLYSVRWEANLAKLGGKLKIGRFGTGDDFATWPYYYLAMNNAIDGNPQSLPVNTGFSSFPNAVWGGMAELPWGSNSRLRLGTYQVTNPDVMKYHGLNWAIRASDGLMLAAQLEYCKACPGVGWKGQRMKDPRATIKTGAQLEPSYPFHNQRMAIGGYWSTKTQLTFDGSSPPPSTYGIWLHADRTLWREKIGGQALAVWGAFTNSPQPTVATMPVYWSIGLVFYGIEASRPQDSTMLAIYQGRFSDQYLESVGNIGSGGGQETVIELAYRRRISSRTYLQPDIQLVINPNGQSIPNAMVLGLQAGITF